jgi:Glycosyltransferase like family 2
MPEPIVQQSIHQQCVRIRGNQSVPPDASIVIPVNAKADLSKVWAILGDIATYRGAARLEIVLVINNFPEGEVPTAVQEFQGSVLRVICEASVRRPGEPPGFSARMRGLRDIHSKIGVLFDADCRIPNATKLIDWYIAQFQHGIAVAYTHVAYNELQPGITVQARVLVHHLSRWFKRQLLGIPTTRGSNYAVDKDFILGLYDAGFLADEMNVGPTAKRKGGQIMYSGASELHVMTSGRYLTGGVRNIIRYLIYRLRYNLRVLPVRADVAERTGRKNP